MLSFDDNDGNGGGLDEPLPVYLEPADVVDEDGVTDVDGDTQGQEDEDAGHGCVEDRGAQFGLGANQFHGQTGSWSARESLEVDVDGVGEETGGCEGRQGQKSLHYVEGQVTLGQVLQDPEMCL